MKCLKRLELRDLLLAFAKAARKLHGDKPAFVYHDIAARHGDRLWMMSERDFDDLETALAEASEAGDTRSAMRIQDLLVAASSPFLEEPDEDEFMSGGFADVREQLKEVVGFMGEKAFLDMIRKGVGNKEFRELERLAGKGDFLEMLIEMIIEMGPPPGFELPPLIPVSAPVKPKLAKPKLAKPGKPRDMNSSPGEPLLPKQRDLFDD